ncbi:PIKK family atypical protein kinase [Histomonas meleagridis]|uniref:PIKK family atypical protein kinase n=1 Tax=Histomonas meleagridis TaxID=135588 RepID=UPI00355A9FE4|nr:PIKK family atypical protein kinase [Histomonas meleagridis]KAH0806814.1 PIKK family atypical protein kinase [Histomonas meleagridis]
MWENFKHLFSMLIDRVKKLELILLPKVSEQLALKRDFKIAIPGTYSVEHPVPTLYSIEPALQVLSTQQHPRCVFMNSSTHEKVKFLLKGNEDIRLDERVMQFFNLINTLLNHNRTTREMNMQITKYAIIPLAPNAGLITWVTGADTLHQMINEHRALHQRSQSIELEIVMNIVGRVGSQLSEIQKLETFECVSQQCNANEIREILWLRSPNANVWMTKNINFTVTTALISIVGYVIGLGDRHPSNIMVQRETGKVIHIDFGDSFEAAILRNVFPEKVPFRLTRMIVNALDNGSVEGIFRKTCEDVMWILRESKESIVALLEIFVHEPIEAVERLGKVKMQTAIIDRVGEKLKGNDWMLPGYDENQKDLGVEEHVEKLIEQASDPYRYGSHYAGWCPYW